MNLADWNAHIESMPLTSNQLGRIHREFARLGFDEHADRAGRLAITAALAGTGPLGSTRDLTQAQAGLVVRALGEARDPAELPLPQLEPEPEPCPVMTLADVLAALAQAVTVMQRPGLALSRGDDAPA